MRRKGGILDGWPGEEATPVGPSDLKDIEKGGDLEGDSGTSPTVPPPWLDKQRYDKIKPLFQRHAVTLAMSWHVAITVGFAMSPLLDALVFTDTSNSPSKALERYLATAQHLMAWHLGDIFDPTNKAWGSLQDVRGIHANIRKEMNSQDPGKCPSGKSWISMFNMATVQSGFLAGIILNPTRFGLRVSDEDVANYVYFWRCCGYQLGIADEYNLCGRSALTARHIVSQIEDQIVLPDIHNKPPQYELMAGAYIDGLNSALPIPIFSIDSTLAFLFWTLKLEVPALSAADTTRYIFIRVLALAIAYIPGLEEVASALLIYITQHWSPPPAASIGCPLTGRGAQPTARIGIDGSVPAGHPPTIPVQHPPIEMRKARLAGWGFCCGIFGYLVFFFAAVATCLTLIVLIALEQWPWLLGIFSSWVPRR